MIYAIIEGGVVVNIAVADYPVEENWVMAGDAGVYIGDIYDGETFHHDEESILTEEERLRMQNADMKEALHLLGVSVDG